MKAPYLLPNEVPSPPLSRPYSVAPGTPIAVALHPRMLEEKSKQASIELLRQPAKPGLRKQYRPDQYLQAVKIPAVLAEVPILPGPLQSAGHAVPARDPVPCHLQIFRNDSRAAAALKVQ